MRKINLLLSSLLFLCLTGCHYQISSSFDKTNLLVYVSEIENDDLGIIRSAIIRSLAQYNILTSIVSNSSTHQLYISLEDYNADNIGFSYSPTVKIIPKKDIFLVSNEGRLAIKARIILKNQYNQIILKTLCHTDTLFDFEPDLAQTSSHDFSLGQMGMYDEAKNTAETVLFEKLGSIIGKIVSYEIY